MTNKFPPLHLIDSDLALSDSLLREVSERFDTPLYLYESGMLDTAWKRLQEALPPNAQIYYSMKANPNVHLIQHFYKLGASVEVVSLGELALARAASVPGDRIIFAGPGKRERELSAAVNYGLRAIVVESPHELDILERLAQRASCEVRVALRINAGRGGGQISMGGTTQFGMTSDLVEHLWMTATQWPSLTLVGLHGYLGTGILDWRQIEANCRLIMDVAKKLQSVSSKPLTFLDLGGGFGIPYYLHNEPLDLVALRPALATCAQEIAQSCLDLVELAFESGRFLVGPSGVFLSRVLDVKSNGGKNFVVLDGGTNVFGLQAGQAGARALPIRVVGNMGTAKNIYTLCGPLCTSADRLAVDIMLPTLQRGDLIAIYQAGAYGLTASPGLFLSHGYPNEFLFRDNILHQIRHATSLDSLIADSGITTLIHKLDNKPNS